MTRLDHVGHVAAQQNGVERQEEADTDKLIVAVIRGDMSVNEVKLGHVTEALALRPASADEIAPSGAVAGYASPIGLKGVLVVVDESVTTSPNLVAGANEEGYHLKNVNYGRDFEADLVADIAAVEAGDGCSKCGQPLETSRGVEVGHIFQLGTCYVLKLHQGLNWVYLLRGLWIAET